MEGPLVKFRVERDVFADAVSWAARTLPNRPAMPMLAGLVIDATKSVVLSSFDYEVSARVEIDATVEDTGRVLVPGRLLSDISRSLPNQPVVVELDGTRVSVTCGRASFALPTLSIDDYPTLPDMPSTSGDVEGAAFATAVSQVVLAAGRDDTLPTLTGVRIEIDGPMITLAATDRYRLAVRELPWIPQSSSMEAATLIPARTLGDTAKALADADTIHIALSAGGSGEGLLGFEGAGRRTTTRLLDGDFPNYRTLLPSESASVATIDTPALVEAVKRVALVAERNTPVRLSFSAGELLLRAGANEEAFASEAVEATLDGDDIEIAFNPQFLLDGLGAIDSAVTTMSFTQASRPAVLTAGDDTDVRYRYLLMPVRLAG